MGEKREGLRNDWANAISSGSRVRGGLKFKGVKDERGRKWGGLISSKYGNIRPILFCCFCKTKVFCITMRITDALTKGVGTCGVGLSSAVLFGADRQVSKTSF